MQVLADEVAKWFQGFENLEPESGYVHADKDELFYTHPEAKISGHASGCRGLVLRHQV
jgi:hypothetical protein